MVRRYVRIGQISNAFIYDDGDYSAAMETDAPIRAGTPIAGNDVLRKDDLGVFVGDVVGPASSTDNAIVRFNSTSGKLIQNSLLILDDSGNLSKAGDLDLDCGSGYTLRLVQPVWEDRNVSAYNLGGPAAYAPVETTIYDLSGVDTGIYTIGFNVADKVSGVFEVPHHHKELSDAYFHVHWQGTGAAPSGTDKVKWKLILSYGRDGSYFTAVSTKEVETDIDTQYKIYHSEFSAMGGGVAKCGDQFAFTFERVAASADEYAGLAVISTMGVHYQIDTIGSRSKTAK